MNSRITPAEQRVCLGVANGLTNREIAAELGVKPQTVKNRLVSMFQKLGIHNRAQLVGLAFRMGLVK